MRADQIILQVSESREVTNRYLWGPNVDQFLADEQLPIHPGEGNGHGHERPSPSGRGVGGEGGGNGNGNGHGHNQRGEVLWALTDHLNTVRDLAVYDSESGLTAIANHLVYAAFGELISQTDAKTTTLLLFTARPTDLDTNLQNNLNRWYDAQVGRWLSEDPIGFESQDANPYRYCDNAPSMRADPAGLVTSAIGIGADVTGFIGFEFTGQAIIGIDTWNPLDWRFGAIVNFGPRLTNAVDASIGVVTTISDARTPEELEGISGSINLGANGAIVGGNIELGNLDPLAGGENCAGARPTSVSVNVGAGPSVPGPYGGAAITGSWVTSISPREAWNGLRRLFGC